MAVVVGMVFRVVIVATDAPPFFDVFYIQQAAGDALLGGIDPYLTQVWVNGYLYLPLAAIAAAAGELFGDARWASIAGDLMVVVALVVFARRVGAAAGAGLALAGRVGLVGGRAVHRLAGVPGAGPDRLRRLGRRRPRRRGSEDGPGGRAGGTGGRDQAVRARD